MFNEVRRYDKNGKLIQVIPPEELSSYHWTDFHKEKKYSRKAVTLPGDPNKRSEPEEVG